MKKLFTLLFAILLAVPTFAKKFGSINLDDKVLQQYNDLITTRHTAGDYRGAYNTVWVKFDHYNLTFKNREKLPSSNWRDWVNAGKNNEVMSVQIAVCYPQDNSDIINELGSVSNNFFNDMISAVKIGNDTGNVLSANILCAPLQKDKVTASTIKIIRLQKIQKDLKNFIYGDSSLNPLESSMSEGNKDKIGNGNFAVYLKLAEKINNIINTEAKVIESEIDSIWAKALQNKEFVKKRDPGYIENLEMIKISKNWLIGTSSRLPRYLQDNPDKPLSGQSERLLKEFKNPNVKTTTMIKAKLETLDPVKTFEMNEENLYYNQDIVLLYLPDEEIPEPINKRWAVDIFVPVNNSKMIEKVFTNSGWEINKVRVRGEVLDLQRGSANQGTAIFLNNGLYKGCLIGYSVEWEHRSTGGQMVQLITADSVKFIEETISAVTPDKWEEIKSNIFFE